MKKMLIIFFVSVGLLISAPHSISSQLTIFNNEIEAQNHCSNDAVVWLNLPTGVWHKLGSYWYERTKNGAYVCRLEAAAAGDRESLNGS
jgi:hypothetical protein